MRFLQLALLVGLLPRAEAFPVEALLAFHDRPELVPVDGAMNPVALLVLVQVGVGDGEARFEQFGDMLIDELLPDLIVRLEFDAPLHQGE